MDYKCLIKNRELRLKILQILSFIPDDLMLRLQYFVKTGHYLNLKKPERFTEKLQWYKLYYKNPLMIQCVDKYDVREYVKSKGLEKILIPCYGVYDSLDSIEWDILPEKFVIKDTLGGGGNAVIIVKNKKEEEVNSIKTQISNWLSVNAHKRTGGREWPYYSGKKHRIIIEEYIEPQNKEEQLIEYKFFCFNGKPKWLYVLIDRNFGVGVKLGIFNADFTRIDAERVDEISLDKEIKKPENFEEMKLVSSKLSSDFPEARIDLYNINGEIKFGEITFYDGSGYMKFDPDEFDFTLGKDFILPKKKDT